MKLLKFALLSLGVAAQLNAGVVSLSSVQDFNGNDYLFQSSAGVNLSSGIVAMGVFDTPDALIATTDLNALIADFENLGSDNFVAGMTSAWGQAVPGMVVVDNNYGAPGARLGKTIYVFVGNGTTLANSTEVALLQTSLVVNADTPTTDSNDANFTVLDAATLFYGDRGTGTYDSRFAGPTEDPNQIAKSIRLEVIPEPSIALLGGLGVLGLVVRRRRN